MQLTLNDINFMVQFIDVATKRGAVEGAELASVGELRNRLVSVLQASTSAESQADEEDVDNAEEIE